MIGNDIFEVMGLHQRDCPSLLKTFSKFGRREVGSKISFPNINYLGYFLRGGKIRIRNKKKKLD